MGASHTQAIRTAGGALVSAATPAMPPMPRVDPLVTEDGKCAYRISVAGQFGLDELMNQLKRPSESMIEAVYFRSESGNIYKAVGTRDGIQLSDLRGNLKEREFQFEKRDGVDTPECAISVGIGKCFWFGEIETNKITAIEFVTTDRYSKERLEFVKEWGAAKHTVLVDEFARAVPKPDVLPRPAADLFNAPSVYEFNLQSEIERYLLNRTAPAPAVYVETQSGGRLVAFAEGARVLLVDINQCVKVGKYLPHDLSSYWHPDKVGPTRTLTVGDNFRYATPAPVMGFDYYETSPVQRLVPLDDFGKRAEGIAPQDELIRALHREIGFVPRAGNGAGDTTVISSRSGDTTVLIRP